MFFTHDQVLLLMIAAFRTGVVTGVQGKNCSEAKALEMIEEIIAFSRQKA